MPTVDYERLIWEDYPSEDTPINAENLNHLEEGVAGLYHDYTALEKEVTETSEKVNTMVGAPLVATLAVNMIDKSKVYVYTGSETGYTAGNWYYWDGTQWQSGGVYNSVAVNTDKTLTVEDMAADGKATGVRIKEEAKFNLLDLGEKTGNPIILKDGGEDAPVKDLKVTLEPVQDLHGYDHPWPAAGGKNKMVFADINQTANGVTCSSVKDADGNIIAYKFTGTATAYTAFVFGSAQSMGLVNGQSYTLSDENGRPTFQLAVWDATSSTWAARTHNNPTSFTCDSSHTLSIQIYVDNGQATNITLYPMIRLSSVSDATFEPYSNICPIYPPHHENLLNVTGVTQTTNGVTFTVHDDGSVTANGTATANAIFYLNGSFSINDNQKYIYSGLTGGSTTTYRMECYWRGEGGTNKGSEVLTSGEKTICVSDKADAVKIDTFIIVVLSGATVNNVTFYPMLRHSYVKDSTFVPYGNQLLTKTEGKNRYQMRTTSQTQNGVTATPNSDGTIALSGTATGGNVLISLIENSEEINTLFNKGGTFSLSFSEGTYNSNTLNVSIEYKDVSGGSSKYLTPNNPVTIPQGGVFARSALWVSQGNTVQTLSHFAIQLEVGSSASAFEPYHSIQTFPTALPEPIYSAKVDVTTGEMVVDKGMVDLGTVNYSKDGYNRFFHRFQGENMKTPATNADVVDTISSIYPIKPYNNIIGRTIDKIFAITVSSSQPTIFIYDTSYNDTAEFKSAMSGVQLLYELATPLVYHLTPTEVTTLLGHNLISSDGRMELTYRRNRPAFFEREEMYKLLPLGDLSGNPAYCDDGADDVPVKDMTITIEPVQDLHGYDHPWPAGGGKNLLNVTANTTTINGITYTVNKDTQGNVVSINANGTSTGTAYINLGIPSLKAGTYKFYIFSSGLASKWYVDCPDSSHQVNSEGGTFTVSSDGNVNIWFNISPNQTVNNVLFYPMIAKSSVTVTAYETYTNECPITGYESVDVVRTGVNVINFDSYTGRGEWIANYIIPVTAPYLTRRVTFSGSGQYLFRLYGISNGTETALDTFAYGASVVDVKPVSQYDHIHVNGYSNNASNSFSECFVGFGDSSSALPYEPYKGQTVTTDLGRTVYGGTLDVTTGVLTVDRVAKVLTIARNLSGTYLGSIIYNSGSPETSDADFSKPFICNRLQYIGSSTSGFKYGTCINAQSYSFNLWVKDGAFTNLNEATEWLGNNETQIVYYLATPLTYHLDKEEITTLLGSNTFTTDAKTLDLTYRKDLGLYIKKLIETT